MTRKKIIKQIERIRTKNNKLWMGYVELAFKYAPKEATALHKQVRKYDAQIGRLGRKLEQ